MNPIKLYFYKWLQGGNKTFDFNGILLTPRLDEAEDFIHWDIQNHNDVSYTSYAINNFIDNELFNFSRLTASEFYDRLYRKQSVKVPKKIYINHEDYDKFVNLAQSVETYKYEDVKANMYVFDMGFDVDSDVFSVNLDIKLLYPTDPNTRDKLTYSQVQDVMLGLNEDDRFIEYIDGLFARLLNEIWDIPTLIDKDNMSIQVYPRFYTDKGQKIRTW
jgi:hypothetical protein